MSSCAWCNDAAVHEARVTGSIRVPVCRRHMDMIQRNRAEKATQEALKRTRRELGRRPGTGGIR